MITIRGQNLHCETCEKESSPSTYTLIGMTKTVEGGPDYSSLALTLECSGCREYNILKCTQGHPTRAELTIIEALHPGEPHLQQQQQVLDWQ